MHESRLEYGSKILIVLRIIRALGGPDCRKGRERWVAIEKCTTPVGGASKSRIFPVKLEEGGKKKIEKRRRKINK